MKTLKIESRENQVINTKENLKYYVIDELSKFKNSMTDFLKILYVGFVLILLLAVLVELKGIFNVDIFPGIDTPFDNILNGFKANVGGIA